MLQVMVLDVDIAKKRISLSCKTERETKTDAASKPKSESAPRDDRSHMNRPSPARSGGENSSASKFSKPKPPEKSHSLNDLLSKFNQRM